MLHTARIRRARTFATVGLTALLLASCTDLDDIPKHLRPLPASLERQIETKGMKETAPILIRIFKEDSTLEVWKKQEATGRFALLKSYEICKWSGDLGPKMAEGDRQAPEGFYTITPAQMNPNSNYHLAFNLGYPNAFDQSLGRTGSHLMVHGACSSRGCYSMDDEQIQEIYTLARLAFQGGQRNFQVQAFPFRMTPENMAKHRSSPHMPFWRMLKVGYDHFEVTGQEPKVDVCASQYVFNATPEGGMSFAPTANCPPMSVPDSIRVAVSDKEAKDDAKMMIIASKLEADEAKQQAKAQPAPTMLASAPASSHGVASISGVQGGAVIATSTAAPAPATTVASVASGALPVVRPGVQSAYVAPAEPPRTGITGFFSKLFN